MAGLSGPRHPGLRRLALPLLLGASLLQAGQAQSAPPFDGASTLRGAATVTPSGGVAVAGSPGWNINTAVTALALQDTAGGAREGIRFSLGTRGAHTFVGLTPTAAQFAYTLLGYAFYLHRDGRVRIWEDGRQVWDYGYQYQPGPAGTVFDIRIARTGGGVVYALDGVVVYESKRPLPAGTRLFWAVNVGAGANFQLTNTSWTPEQPCTLAPAVCAGLQRHGCFDANTCGPCLSGHSGAASGQTACSANPADDELGGAVTFTNFQGAVAPATGGSSGLTLSGSTSWGFAGCTSYRTITANSSVIGVTFAPAQTTSAFMIGLANSSALYHHHFNDIDFAFYVQNTGLLSVYESGRQVWSTLAAYAPSDELTVRVGHRGMVQYAANGQVVYESRKTPSFPLVVDVSFASARTPTTGIRNITWEANYTCDAAGASGDCSALGRLPCFDDNVCGPCFAGHVGPLTGNAACVQVTPPAQGGAVAFTDFKLAVATPSSNGLVRQGTGSWGSSGAVSVAALDNTTSVRGFSFTANQTDGAFMMGLGFENRLRGHHYNDIDFAFYIAKDGILRIYESGRSRLTLFKYSTTDVLGVRLSKAGDAVEYSVNSIVVYVSKTPPQFPLVVDVSFADSPRRVIAIKDIVWDTEQFCDAAGVNGECSGLSRLPCFENNVCGPCFAGHQGPLTGNTACQAVSPPALGGPVAFTELELAVATPSSNGLVRQGTGSWGTSGAVSVAALDNTTSVRGFSFTANQTDGAFMMGLGFENRLRGHHYNDIDFAFYIAKDGILRIYESGRSRLTLFKYSTTDVLGVRLSKAGDAVEYSVNSIVVYVSKTPPQFPLVVDVSFADSPRRVIAIKDIVWDTEQFCDAAGVNGECSGLSRLPCFENNVCGPCFAGHQGPLTGNTACQAVSPPALGGPVAFTELELAVATPSSNGLVRQGTGSWGTSGAVSVAALDNTTSVRGFSFTANQTDGAFMMGLGFENRLRGHHYNDIDFAFYIAKDGILRIYESGRSRLTLFKYSTTDVLGVRLSKAGDAVEYSVNSIVVYVSKTPPQFPLVVDVSFADSPRRVIAIKDIVWDTEQFCDAAGVNGECSGLSRLPCFENNVCGPCFAGHQGPLTGNTACQAVSPPALGGPVAFTELELAVATPSSNGLVRQGTGSWGTSGAVSVAALDNTTSVRGFSFTANQTDGAFMMGLGFENRLRGHHYNDIDFAFYIAKDGILRIYESGRSRLTLFKYSTTDVLGVRLSKAGDAVEYSVNSIVVYVSKTPPQFPLVVDVSFADSPRRVIAIKDIVWDTEQFCDAAGVNGECSGLSRLPCFENNVCGPCFAGHQGPLTGNTACQAVSPPALGGPVAFTELELAVATPSSNGLVRQGTGSWGTSGAVSVAALDNTTSVQGFSFIPGQTDGAFMMGLGFENRRRKYHYNDIDYAWYVAKDSTLRIYESGRGRATLFKYSTTDVLGVRLSETGDAIEYSVNQAVAYVSKTPPQFPLVVDVSFADSPRRMIAVTNITWDEQKRCSSAGVNGDCSALNRAPCFALNQCGRCFAGHQGTERGNTACQVVNPPTQGGPVAFTELTSATITTANNGLLRQGSGSWGSSGAVSVAAFDNTTNVRGFSFRAGQANASAMVGLGFQNRLSKLHFTDIDYAFYLAKDGILRIYENGRGRATIFKYSPSDVLGIRLSKAGDSIEYDVNQLVVYTSKVLPQFPLVVDVSLADSPDKLIAITDIVWDQQQMCDAAGVNGDCSVLNRGPCFTNNVCGPCFAGHQGTLQGNTACAMVSAPARGGAVAFTDLQDVVITPSRSGLLRHGTGGWGSSGAVSVASFDNTTAVRGVSFTAGAADATFMLGLGAMTQLSKYSYLDIDFAFYCHKVGDVRIYESGRSRGFVFEGYSADTVFEIRISEHGEIEYAINSRVVYTSKTPPSYPLVVDVSLADSPSRVVAVNNITWSQQYSCSRAGIAGDCSALFRDPCFSDDVCGQCHAGYVGPLRGNAPCTLMPAPVAGGFITFTGFQNVDYVNSFHGLRRNGTGYWGGAGAVSAAAINAISNIGVSFSPGSTTPGSRGSFMVGLAHSSRVSFYSYTDLDWAFYLHRNGLVYVFENGRNRGSIANGYAATDVFVIRISTAATVEYIRNREVVYVSTVAPSYPLVVDASFNDHEVATGTTLVTDIKWVGPYSCALAGAAGDCGAVFRSPCVDGDVCGRCLAGYAGPATGNAPCTPVAAAPQAAGSPVTFTDFLQVEVNNATHGLLRRGTGPWGSAGCVSVQSIEANSTAVSGVAFYPGNRSVGRFMVGLAHGSALGKHTYTDIDFAWFFNSDGSARVYENGRQRGIYFAGYSPSDRFEVRVSQRGEVVYAVNGATVYVSLTAPQFPLVVDVSIETNLDKALGVVAIDNITWSRPQQCRSAGLAGDCAAVFRHACFDDNVCGPCLASHVGPSAGNTPCTLVNAPTNGGPVVFTGFLQAEAAPAIQGVRSLLTSTWGLSGCISVAGISNTSSVPGFRFQPAQTDANFMASLSYQNRLSEHGYTDLDFALYLTATGTVHVYENGRSRGLQYDGYGLGDRFEIRVAGDKIEYIVNKLVIYTSTQAPRFPLSVDVSFSSSVRKTAAVANVTWSQAFSCAGAGVAGDCAAVHRSPCFINDVCGRCYAGFAGPSAGNAPCTPVAPPVTGGPIVWTDLRNTEVVTATQGLRRPGSGSWGTAGAVSAAGIQAPSAVTAVHGISFSPARTDGNLMVGLTNDSPLGDFEYQSIKFAFYLTRTGLVYVFESGRNRGIVLGSYQTSDVLEVRVVNATSAQHRAGNWLVQYVINEEVVRGVYTDVRFPLVADVTFANSLGNALQVDELLWAPRFDCSLAGNCAALHRTDCYDKNVCGRCLAGYTGGPTGNSACTVTAPAQPGTPVVFMSFEGVKPVAAYNGLLREGSASWGSAGAVSLSPMTNASRANGVGFTSRGEASLMCGLASENRVSRHDFGDIDFAFYLRKDRSIFVYENGGLRLQAGFLYADGDRFEVRVAPDNTVYYAVNQEVLYVSRTKASLPLVVDVSFADSVAKQAIVENVTWTHPFRCAGAGIGGACGSLHRAECYDNNVCTSCFAGYVGVRRANTVCRLAPVLPTDDAISFTDFLNAESYATNNLVSAWQGSSWGGAGATSSRAITNASVAADGRAFVGFSFRAGSTSRLMVGLSSDAELRDHHYLNIDFAFFLHSDGTWRIYENGRQALNSYVPYRPGDAFALRVGQDSTGRPRLEYAHNRRTVYQSRAVVPFPLVVDTAFHSSPDGRPAVLQDFLWLRNATCGLAGRGDGDCFAVNRYDCWDGNLCQDCLAGFTGLPGPSNRACVPSLAPSTERFVQFEGFLNTGPTADGRGLTKLTTSGSWGSGGANSIGLVFSNTSFHLGFRFRHGAGIFMAGLNRRADRYEHGYQDLDFAWYVANNGLLQVRESGSATWSLGSAYRPGDRFSVLANPSSGAVEFWHNGTLQYTSKRPLTYPLVVDVSTSSGVATLEDVEWITRDDVFNCTERPSAPCATLLNRRACAGDRTGGCGSCLDGYSAASSDPATACMATTTTPAPTTLATCTAAEFRALDGSCRACTACSPGSHLATLCTAVRDAACVACSGRCAVGEHLVESCDPQSLQGPRCAKCDASCVACTGPSASECVQCAPGQALSQGRCISACAVGQFKANATGLCSACDASCGACFGPAPVECTACPAGRFLHQGQCIADCAAVGALASGGRCTACSACAPGYRKLAGCANGRDTLCRLCEPGVTYQPAADQPRCFPASLCPLGEGEVAGATLTSDRTCGVCPAGQFSNVQSAAPCTACSTCPSGQHAVVACSAASDTVCEACRPCPASFYASTKCGAATDNVCTRCLRSCPAGQFLVGACTADQGPRCVACDPTCATCNGTAATDCRSCLSGFALQATPSGLECQSQCTAGFYEAGGKCLPCHGSCRTCAGPSRQQCLSCGAGLKYFAGQCVASCQAVGAHLSTDGAACIPCLACRAGQFSATPCSETTDTVCSSCPAGTFQDLPGQGQCKPVTVCPVGTSTSVRATVLSDQQCAPCSRASYADQPGLSQCRACRACQPSSFETAPCTATSDRTCSACTACPAGSSASGGCTGTQDRFCSVCTTSCPRGMFLAGVCDPLSTSSPRCRSCNSLCAACDGANPNDCTACPPGSFLLENGRCESTCGFGRFERSDGSCGACDASCGDCDGPSNAECLSCPVANEGDGEVPTYLSATNSRRTCSAFCAVGYFANQATGECQACQTCVPGSYESFTCAASKDSVCSPCQLGVDYQDSADKPFCNPVRTCAAGEREVKPATLTSNRECGACFAGTYSSRGQTECLPWSDCVFGVTYVAAQGSASSDRVCSRVSTRCALSDQFIATPATIASDIQCQPKTQCTPAQYELAAGNLQTDRTCQPLTVCPSGWQEAIAARATSDRVCKKDVTAVFSKDYNTVFTSPSDLSVFRDALTTVLEEKKINVFNVVVLEGSILAIISVTDPQSESRLRALLDTTGLVVLFKGTSLIGYSEDGVASRSGSALADNTGLYVGLIGGVVCIALVGLAVFVVVKRRKGSSGAGAVARTVTAFENPIYSADDTKRKDAFPGFGYDAAGYAEGLYAEPEHELGADPHGYFDVCPASTDSGGYLDVHPDPDNDGYLDVHPEQDDGYLDVQPDRGSSHDHGYLEVRPGQDGDTTGDGDGYLDVHREPSHDDDNAYLEVQGFGFGRPGEAEAEDSEYLEVGGAA